MTRRTSLPKRILATAALLSAAFSVQALPQKRKFEEVTITKCWSYPVEGGLDVAQRDSVNYVARDGGVVEAVSSNGTKVWATELGGTIVSNVEPKFISVFVVTAAADGKAPQLRSLSTETGVVKWSAQLRPSKSYRILYFEIGVAVFLDDGSIEDFIASTGERGNGRIVPENETIDGDELGAITRTVGGKESWKFRTGGSITKIIETPDAAIAASNDNFIYMITRADGDVRWKHRMSGRITSMTRLGDDLLIASSSDDHGVEILELRKGRLVSRTQWAGEDTVADIEPVDDTSFLVLSPTSLDRYSINGCSK